MTPTKLVQILALTLLPSLAGAQWLNTPLPGVPRTADGKPNLLASVPRAHDGRPDLSGVWASVVDRTTVPGPSIGGAPTRAAANIAVGVPGGAPLTPWARDIRAARRKVASAGIPSERCLPSGIPPDMLRPSLPFKIVQASG